MNKGKFLPVAVSIVVVFFVSIAHAAPPALINYQGRLLDGTGLISGEVGLSLRLFNGSNVLVYEDSNTVTAVDGLYATMLGDDTVYGDLAAALTNEELWIEVAVNGVALSPRERMVSVAYALNANETDPVWTAQKSAYATGTPLYGYTETDPVWAAEKSGFATGTPLYAFTEADPQAVLANGSRAMTGNLNMGGNSITNAGTLMVQSSLGIGGVVRTSWPMDASFWSYYPAARTVNMAGYSLTNMESASGAIGFEDGTTIASADVRNWNTGKVEKTDWLAADSTTNYVRRTGDTMTGPLNITVMGGTNGILITSSATNVTIGLNADGRNRGVAVGYLANASGSGVAIGYMATGTVVGVAVGYQANGMGGVAVGPYANGESGAAVGYGANASQEAVAVGDGANAYREGVAVGDTADARNYGVALGFTTKAYWYGVGAGTMANANNLGVAVGAQANGAQTNIAIGYLADTRAGSERIAIGHSVVNTNNNTAVIRGSLYLDGGLGTVYYRTNFGSGGWSSMMENVATGTPLYGFTETDPVWASEKSNYATGTPVYVETDPVFSASVASAISASDTSAWWEAHGWGDHADGGYAAAADLVASSNSLQAQVSSVETAKVSKTGDTMTGNLTINATGGLVIDSTNSNVMIGRRAGAGSTGVAIGNNATGLTTSVAIGNNSSASSGGVAVGGSASAAYGIAIGAVASAPDHGVAVGESAGASHGVAVGAYAGGSTFGTAIGESADGTASGAAVGRVANGSSGGAVVGHGAHGINYGTAIGYSANGDNGGAAIGNGANAWNSGLAVGNGAYAASTNIAIGYQANAGGAGAVNRIAIGRNVVNTNNNSAVIRGALYLDGGSVVYYRPTFGSGAWTDLRDGLATGTPVYAETDPVWAAEKSGYATGTPLYAFAEVDPVWTSASNDLHSQILNLDTAKVSKTGDTMTGKLTITVNAGPDDELVIDSASGGGVSIGRVANGYRYGAAIGYAANGYSHGAAVGNAAIGDGSGAAVGYAANGSSMGAAVGSNANGYNGGSAIGYNANAWDSGLAVGNSAYAASTNIAIGYQANAGGSSAANRIAIGCGVINSNDNSAAIRGTLYLDGAAGIYYRTAFGSGGWSNALYFAPNGCVGIGTASPTNTLAVNGSIKAKEVIVSLDGWADFVFGKDYKLMPLMDVEKYVQSNGHLPDVPSSADVAANGVNLGTMQSRLLQKVEELTLYVIELKKENEELQRRISAMEAQ